MKKINIEFTKEQFLELIKLVSIWEMVINWHKLHDDFDKDAEQMQDFIVKQALKNDIKDYLFKYKWSKEYWFTGGYDISSEKEMEFFDLLEESHKDSFAEDIVEIVSKNEVFLKYNENEFEKINDSKKEKIFSDMIDKVDNEFVENGYENLKINWNSKNPLFL